MDTSEVNSAKAESADNEYPSFLKLKKKIINNK